MLPSSHALLDAEDVEPEIEPVPMEAGNLVPIEDTAPSDASATGDFSSEDDASSDDESLIDPAEDDDRFGGVDRLVGDGATADRIAPMEDGAVPIDAIIRSIVKTRFTSFMNFVHLMVDGLSDDAVHAMLMRPNMSILSICQIADVGPRAERLAARAFRTKYADHFVFGEELNKWNGNQIARFFKLFGESMVRLDATAANRPDIVLQHIAAKCTNLIELQCAITTRTNIDQLRPFFSRLQTLNITDLSIGLGDFRLFNANASLESLTIKCCTSVRMPPIRMPALVAIDVWYVYEPHLKRLSDSMVPFMALNPHLKGYKAGRTKLTYHLRSRTAT